MIRGKFLRLLMASLGLCVAAAALSPVSARGVGSATKNKKRSGASAARTRRDPQRPLRNPFREAYTTRTPSVARADLLACQELPRSVNPNPRNLDPAAFAKMLTGTWVRQLTWNGVVVENNSALFFDFTGNNAVAMMYDQSNLGGGPMWNRVNEIRNNPDQLTRTPRLTFVDCEYEIVDTYYKVSDELLFDGLPVRGATTARAGGGSLREAWKQLVDNRFFRFEQKERNLAKEPGAEMLTPSVGGAFWQVSMQPTNVGRYRGVTLKLNGDYRGAHVGEVGTGSDARFAGQEDVKFAGNETAQFFMSGEKFVASTRTLLPKSMLARTGSRAGNLATSVGGWSTDCADFFALPDPIIWERVVLEPGQTTAIGSVSKGKR